MKRLTLKQKKLFLKQEFTLLEDGVIVERSTPFNREKYLIRYDDISPSRLEIDNRFSPRVNWTIAGIFVYLMRICCLTPSARTSEVGYLPLAIFSAIAVILVIVYNIRTRNEIIYRAAPAYLRFLKNKPSYNELEGFIAVLYGNQKEYIYNYGERAEASTLEELERLAHLKNIQALTDDEFDELKRRTLEKDRISRQFFGGSSMN